jgi:hypothetical protein
MSGGLLAPFLSVTGSLSSLGTAPAVTTANRGVSLPDPIRSDAREEREYTDSRDSLFIPNPATRIAEILMSDFEIEPYKAQLQAEGFLMACRRQSLNPLKLIQDCAIRWRMESTDPLHCPKSRIGVWLMARINQESRGSRPEILNRPTPIDWSDIRKKIISESRPGGNLRGSDLSDYWDYLVLTLGKSPDKDVIHAVARYEAAGLVSRHGSALTVRAEHLKIPAERTARVGREEAWISLQCAVQKRWPESGERWQDIVETIMKDRPWWRTMMGEAILGLADWIDSDRDPQTDPQTFAEAMQRGKATSAPGSVTPAAVSPLERVPNNDDMALTEFELEILNLADWRTDGRPVLLG